MKEISILLRVIILISDSDHLVRHSFNEYTSSQIEKKNAIGDFFSDMNWTHSLKLNYQ